jgi:hypothetical protein
MGIAQLPEFFVNDAIKQAAIESTSVLAGKSWTISSLFAPHTVGLESGATASSGRSTWC